jgi:hypothetical protein
MSFVPECYGRVGTTLISFEQGQPWIHEKLITAGMPIYNKFYDVEFPWVISLVDNLNVDALKRYEGICINSNEILFAKQKGDITVFSNYNGSIVLESKLPSGKFKNIKGKFESEFLRDMNTPGTRNENDSLINGDFLEGQYAVIKLTNETTNEVVLFSVKLYISMINNI